MAGIRLPPEESELFQPQQQSRATADLVSDDERSVAADSWSIKSEYGSTLDDDQRHADAAEALYSANFRASSDYNSDKEEPDPDGIPSMLGLQSYWDAAYADELANFREHGHSGEVWDFISPWLTMIVVLLIVVGLPIFFHPYRGMTRRFGADVMDVVASWTKSLCIEISQGHMPNHLDDFKSEAVEESDKCLSSWSVLDIGTGNGLLLQELAKQGFSNLTGVDYSEDAINLAQSLANRDGFSNINFLVDDVLETKLKRQFHLVMDKGTLDAIGLHPDGPLKRIMYWDSVSKLVAPGGLLVITSCNSTKDELVQEVLNLNQRKVDVSEEPYNSKEQEPCREPPFHYLNHVRTYPTFMFGGSEGSRVATVAFLRN